MKLNLITQHPLWKPTDKVFYSKYECCIELGPFTDYNPIFLEYAGRSTVRYKFNKTEKRYDIYCKIYTSDYDIVLGLMEKFPFTEIKTPINEKHKLLLHDYTTVVREKLYYGKYRFKVLTFFNRFKNKNDNIPEVKDYIRNNMSAGTRFRKETWPPEYDIPTMYTSNEKDLMLYKLRFNTDFNILVMKVMTFEELKSKA